jgi:hypothetical protein
VTLVGISGKNDRIPYLKESNKNKNIRNLYSCMKAEPLVSDPSPFEVESATAKLKRYKSPGSDQVTAELIQASKIKVKLSLYQAVKAHRVVRL